MMEKGLAIESGSSVEYKDMIGKAVGIMFASRTYSHIAHLKTSSYSTHKALNEFYDDIVDLADDLAEAAQGQFGKLNIPFVSANGNVNDPASVLQNHLKQLETTMMDCEEEYLENIFQEVQKLYRSTLYKLIELS